MGESAAPLGGSVASSQGGPWLPRRWIRGTLWIVAYVLLAAFPLLLLLTGPVPRGGGWAWDFAMALGFAGLAIMGLQFVLTARFRRATAPFGIDIVYYFHRWAALGGFGLIVAHYLILRLRHPAALGSADPRNAEWPMTAGRVALALFAVLIVTSLGRKALRLEYDRWRVGHAVMAVMAVALAGWHIRGAGHYTAETWRGALWTGYTALWLGVLGYIRVLKPLRLLRSPYRVIEVRAERGRAWTLTLQPMREPMPDFRPGQFAWLSLGRSPFRAGEHPFSIASSATLQPAVQFTIKELGDFTRTIRHTRTGTIAYLDGPHGVFTPDAWPQAPGFVFIAGGIGIAPIMSMLRTLADRSDRRPLLLVFGNRHWNDVLFREEIETLASRLTLRVVHVLQEPPPDWRGATGILSPPVIRAALTPDVANGVCFLCGPKPMNDSVQHTLRGLGVPLSRIQCELFDMV
jgi:predicted ferric reductase